MGSKKSTAIITIIGGAILVIILVFGTIWMGQNAKENTERAVHSVSLLYLDELAGRREQVVAKNLRDKIDVINTALELMTENDFSDSEHLQEYQSKMKQLFVLDRFAFVDEDGLIYTANGTQTDVDQYDFNHRTIEGAEISIKNLKSADKKVVIALPVNISFGDKTLVVCFMEIDMKEMLSGVSMVAQEGGATFCNIYTSAGVALSDTVLGGLAVEDNLMEAMKNADYDAGYSYDALTQDFSLGRRGKVCFTYNGVKETLSYVPVEGTNWFLTYLIRESVISDNISSISAGIIRRSVVQTILTIVVLAAIFAYIILKNKQSTRLRIEKETADAEHRVKQADLEQRLAMQEEMIKQKVRQEQQEKMITALASDYRSVYYVELDKDEGVCYQARTDLHGLSAGERFRYLEAVTEYCNAYVTEPYREEFLRFIQPDSIREGLKENLVIGYRYMICVNGKESYEMVRFAGVRHPEDRDDHIVHNVGACFTDVDAETRRRVEQQQTLANALSAAEGANRAKTAFLSNMSHEIRTPMNAIIGLDSLALRDRTLSEKTREYLQKIKGSAKHLLGLINDILDMSRIESGKLSLRKEEFSFSEMLEQINTMVMAQCIEKGLSFECRINGRVDDHYIGDDMKLKQVLVNVLSNAVKFTDAPGSVTLSIEKINDYEDQSTLRFSIKDTGIGISKEFLPQVFDSFAQENGGRNDKYGSTGLGLAITKSIVELMNGTITVESEKGVGTEFVVIVTLRNCKNPNSEIDTISTKDMRVLVVDDDPIACEHARLVMEESGIRTDACLSGKEALDILEVSHAKHEPYNLVLLDWKMPEMDGVEVAKEVRKRYDNETTVIILTAYNWDEIMDEALHVGVDGFLAKPLFASNVVDEFVRIARRNCLSVTNEKRRADLDGRRILLAEDFVVNAEIVKELMGLRGATVDYAENGRIAVETFERSETGYYDAILMDVRMPEMDGLEATRAIRALNRPDASSVPIIAMTANAFDEDVQRSLQAGMNAHLSKPVEAEHLYKTLEELIWKKDNGTAE